MEFSSVCSTYWPDEFTAGLSKANLLPQVEDIIDTGATLKAVIAKLRDLGAASVKSAVLLNKEERRNVVIEPDYAALKVRLGHVMALLACDHRPAAAVHGSLRRIDHRPGVLQSKLPWVPMPNMFLAVPALAA